MAIFYPSIHDILLGKVVPEPGELHLLRFLEKTLNDDYEVFFNPYMNGDRPDVIIIKPNQGILIIEVKDYDLKHYEIDAKTKNWKVLANDGKYLIKSPVQQVLKYKDNLFDLHVNELLSLKISDIRNANMISCAVYFHNATEDALDKLLVRPFEKDSKYLTFLKYNILFLGSDSLNDQKFLSLLRRRHLAPGQLTGYFPEHLHTKIKCFMLPPYHQKTDGKYFTYNGEQQKLIYDTERKNIRIKGVVGSGKTTVLAARAVELHKRTEGEILILSYNITLRNYLKDKLSQVRENFSWTAFTILNYHIFINNELNNLQVDVTVPAEFNEWPDSRKERYFEDTYYSNTLLFEDHKDKLKKFPVILIDEIQDYKSKWMEILKTYFLEEGGYYMVLGDDKQNIYGNPVLGREMPVNVQGRPSLLKTSYRSQSIVKELIFEFQKVFLSEKYIADDEKDFKGVESKVGSLEFEEQLDGSINYMYLPSSDAISSLYTIIHENSLNKGIHPNDITILGTKIKLLKEFDSHYRHRTGEKTNTMFESHEDLLIAGMNYSQTDIKYNREHWINVALVLLNHKNEKSFSEGFKRLAELLICKTQLVRWPEFFETRYTALCRKNKINTSDFDTFVSSYDRDIKNFMQRYSEHALSSDAKRIRDNKKIHFWANRGTVKISTVHSFKGWESDLVYLIIENVPESMSETFFELIYTGITRARYNLIILNYGNEIFHQQFLPVYEEAFKKLN